MADMKIEMQSHKIHTLNAIILTTNEIQEERMSELFITFTMLTMAPLIVVAFIIMLRGGRSEEC